VSLWKHIRRGCNSFSKFVTIEVHDGSWTRFWHDTWCEDCPLKDSFPELFFIARDKDALVADHMLVHNDEVHWDMNFITLVHDWEVNIVSSSLNDLYFARSRGDEDKCCWVPSKRRSFEVRTFY
jgi:hypothetical protein